MATLNDVKYAALRKITGSVGPATVNDLEREWLTGATSSDGTLHDKLMAYLALAGFTTGTLHDRLMAWLGGQGYEGTLNERFYRYWSALVGDIVPPDTPNNLLLDYNNLTSINWDSPDMSIVYQGEGWWEITSLSPDTTKSLVQFYLDAAALGKTYRIQAEFRNKGAIGNDYRLAVAEYFGNTWQGAITTDLDTLGVEDPTPVLKTADITVSSADTDRLRFAVQFVNPPQAGMKIEMRLPALLLL